MREQQSQLQIQSKEAEIRRHGAELRKCQQEGTVYKLVNV